jgi:4-hydroxy-tetrahydrodipicolinate synthase
MFKGAGVAIVTPFKNGSVDYESFEKLIDFQLEHNTQALVVLGTTGEAPTIYKDEREKLIRVSVEKAGGKVPVIIGTGTNNTEDAKKHTMQAEKLGQTEYWLSLPTTINVHKKD